MKKSEKVELKTQHWTRVPWILKDCKTKGSKFAGILYKQAITWDYLIRPKLYPSCNSDVIGYDETIHGENLNLLLKEEYHFLYFCATLGYLSLCKQEAP